MRFLSVLFKLYVGLWFVLFLVIFYPFFWILSRGDPPYISLYKLLRVLSHIFMRLCFFSVEVVRGGSLPKPPFIIAPNHTSYIDILCIYHAFRDYTIFTGKKELLSVPLFNIFFKKMNIPVDRENPYSSAITLQKCEEAMKYGACIVVFPEGTIPVCAPKIGALKQGAFKLSVKTGFPIVPVVMPYNWKRFGGHYITDGIASPGTIKIIIGEPIYPHECNNSPDKIQEKWVEVVTNILQRELPRYEIKKGEFETQG